MEGDNNDNEKGKGKANNNMGDFFGFLTNLPISSQSLNGANSASRRASEVPKKGKSSEFNPKDYEQVKSSPSRKVLSHDGSNLYPKMAKNGSIGQNQGCCTRL